LTKTEQLTKKGNNFFVQREHGKIREAHTPVIRLNSDTACLNGDRAKARDKTIAKYIKRILNPKSAKSYYNRGDAYSENKNYDAAIADYTRAIEIKPNFIDAYIQRGFAHCHKNDFKKGLADWDQVIKMKPDDGFGYGVRGRTYLDQGDYDKAIADCERALELTQDDEWREMFTENLEEAKEKRGAIT
jgi:tetratricopeptide (TPR) repeat protein